MKEGMEQAKAAQLTRIEQIIAYFVRKCAAKKPLGRTQLMKLVYLADHESRRYLGRPLSELEYYWHFFGPWDEQILKAVKDLEEQDLVREERIVYPTGQRGYEYKPGIGNEVTVTLAPIEIEILKYVCTTYADMNLSALLSDVVYETEPMKAAIEADAKGEPLDMAMVNDTRRFEYGISFEDLYVRIQDVRGGRSIPHAEAMALVRKTVAGTGAAA